MTKHCIIADLHIVIDTADRELLHLLAPRYAPFSRKAEWCADIPVLFSLRHLPEPFTPLPEAALTMAEFDCEGAWCVFRQTEDLRSITLLERKGGKALGEMQCDAGYSEARCWLSGEADQREYCYNNFLMMLFAFASMPHKTLLFHASVIGRGNKAYLFLAQSGTGKSTHSALWLKHIPGCELINDDNPAVRIAADGSVMVYGTPWSGKTPCYRDVKMPLGAFVRITRSQSNRIQQEPPIQAFAALLPSCSGIKWDRDLYRAQCDSVSEIISREKVFVLGCRPDREAAEVCSLGVGAISPEELTTDSDFSANASSMKPNSVQV